MKFSSWRVIFSEHVFCFFKSPDTQTKCHSDRHLVLIEDFLGSKQSTLYSLYSFHSSLYLEKNQLLEYSLDYLLEYSFLFLNFYFNSIYFILSYSLTFTVCYWKYTDKNKQWKFYLLSSFVNLSQLKKIVGDRKSTRLNSSHVF